MAIFEFLKVLRLWLERRILREPVLHRYMDDIGSSNDDRAGVISPRRPSRVQRAVDDPLMEMEGMVDEYGSNTTFQFPGFLMTHILEDDEELSANDLKRDDGSLTVEAIKAQEEPRESSVDDPLREIEGMVDEYGSNATFQLPDFLMTHIFEDDEEPSANDLNKDDDSLPVEAVKAQEEPRESSVDDPLREIEGLVDEYGSNTTFQFPGFSMTHIFEDDEEPSANDLDKDDGSLSVEAVKAQEEPRESSVDPMERGGC